MKDYRPAPRLVITLSGGLVSSITSDNVDLSGVTCFVLDEDTEGAEDDQLFQLENHGMVFRQARDITPATAEEHRIYGAMHQDWMIIQ
jgi:hypothetical protein